MTAAVKDLIHSLAAKRAGEVQSAAQAYALLVRDLANDKQPGKNVDVPAVLESAGKTLDLLETDVLRIQERKRLAATAGKLAELDVASRRASEATEALRQKHANMLEQMKREMAAAFDEDERASRAYQAAVDAWARLVESAPTSFRDGLAQAEREHGQARSALQAALAAIASDERRLESVRADLLRAREAHDTEDPDYLRRAAARLEVEAAGAEGNVAARKAALSALEATVTEAAKRLETARQRIVREAGNASELAAYSAPPATT